MNTGIEVRKSSNMIEYSPEKIDLIKRTVCKGATDDELQLFLHVAKKSGLDVFSRQIHAIKRYDSALAREVISFQTGIDGYRLIASRTGLHAGTEPATFIIDEKTGVPISATVTVYKIIGGQKVSFSATARYSEYVALKKDKTPNIFWLTKPFLMLEKCAEALALRKAFPAELSGIYTNEEMEQADNHIEKPVKEPEIIMMTDDDKKSILLDIESTESLSELEIAFKQFKSLPRSSYDPDFLNQVVKLKNERKSQLSESDRTKFLTDLQGE